MVKPGLIVSGIVHIIILPLPVSVRTNRLLNNDREVELYIIDTTPLIKIKEQTSSTPTMFVKAEKIQSERIEESVYKPEILAGKEEKTEYEYALNIIADEPVKEAKSTIVSRKTEDISKTATDSLSDAIGRISIPPLPEESTGEDASEPVEKTFGTTDGPDFTHRVMPEYPPQALRLNKKDTVILLLTIDKDGKLTDVKVKKRAEYGFTEAAIKAVKSSTFRPAMKNGKPVIARAILPIRFEIKGR